MAQTIKMVFQLRRGTTAEWEQYKTIVPAAGEPCFDLELNTLKIGDGVKTYEQLEPIGYASVTADGQSVVMENGVFKLAGFSAAEVGAQPRKNAAGELEWVIPAEGVDVVERVETLENQMEILNGDENVEGSIAQLVKAAINAFAEDVSDDGKVNTIKELVDYVANHGGEAATMAADISALQTLVGDSSVSEQIADAIADLEVAAGGLTSVSVGGVALEVVGSGVDIPIATDAVLGAVKGSDEIEIAEDGSLNITAVNFDKLIQSEGAVLIMDGGGAANE